MTVTHVQLISLPVADQDRALRMSPGSVKGTVLESDDLDADVAALAGKGVKIEDGVQSQPWGRFVTFDDPDGNGIVLQETAPGA